MRFFLWNLIDFKSRPSNDDVKSSQQRTPPKTKNRSVFQFVLIERNYLSTEDRELTNMQFARGNVLQLNISTSKFRVFDHCAIKIWTTKWTSLFTDHWNAAFSTWLNGKRSALACKAYLQIAVWWTYFRVQKCSVQQNFLSINKRGFCSSEITSGLQVNFFIVEHSLLCLSSEQMLENQTDQFIWWPLKSSNGKVIEREAFGC